MIRAMMAMQIPLTMNGTKKFENPGIFVRPIEPLVIRFIGFDATTIRTTSAKPRVAIAK